MSRITRREFLKYSRLALPFVLAPLIQPADGVWRTGLEHASPAARPAGQRPNILMIVFDSLSAQRMSLYGYSRATTPNLDKLAARSTVYHAHYAAGNFTSPGTASLLTGVYPWTHRAFNLASVPPAQFAQKNLFAAFARLNYNCLAYSHNRLADFLLNRFRGRIQTYIRRSTFLQHNRQILAPLFWDDRRIASIGEELAFVRENQSSLFLSIIDQSLDSGRSVEDGRFPRGLPEAFRANFTLETAVDGIHTFLARAPRPFLSYFHLLPPHEPYRTRTEFKDLFMDGREPDPKPDHFFADNFPAAELNRLGRSYDEYLAYADAEFGRLIALLESSGLMDNTVIVFTSDHGQMFERGIHGHITPVLYEPVIRVPLLICEPGQVARRDVYAPTSAVDLLPTLLSIAGGEPPEWCEGTVMPPFQSDTPGAPRSIYVVEAKRNSSRRPLTTASVAVIRERTKLISYFGYSGFDGVEELYDLDRDQEERADLIASRASTAADLRYDLESRLHAANRPYARTTR